MARPGLARICLRDKRWRVSGLARPWRAAALIAALETEPESIPDLLLAAQRFFCGHPFSATTYQGLLGAVRRAPSRGQGADAGRDGWQRRQSAQAEMPGGGRRTGGCPGR